MKSIIFLIILLTAFTIFTINLKKFISYLKIGEQENRTDNIKKRILNTLKIAIGQSKILREPFAGILHAIIFWGFLVLLLLVIEAIIQGFYSPFSLTILGILFYPISLSQDVLGFLIIFAVIFSFYRRFIIKVKRLKSEKEHNFEAGLILTMILVVILSMFGQNLFSVHSSIYDGRIISGFLKNIFNTGYNYTLYEIFWWLHILTVLTFLNLLPFSKHFHVITSIPNVFLSKIGDKVNILKPINLEDENLSNYGALDSEHLTWKQLLDGYTCTECGRCTSVCPANNTGKLLSPRKIIMDIRARLIEKAPLIINKTENELLQKTLVKNYITEQELWACTTCMACMQECPVSIEHVDSIVEMRRGLVLTESAFPAELNPFFKNLENNFSPWAFSQEDRLNWAEGLELKTCAEDNTPEILFWVGCAGAFDARYQKVSRAFAQILKKAGINFKVLGSEEKCNGDAARRIGNEYLAQILIKENIQTFEKYGIKKIITTCPHCYHSLGREYKSFGGNYEVIHHTDFIEKLIKDGSIKLSKSLNLNTTFHDSCYLGRYNNIYSSPRVILNSISGIKLREMPRNKDKGFCCGAGGGRMWMEETEGTRVNIERTNEALQTKADTICSACPFCLTMFSDGLKSLEKNEMVEVKDIAEIVSEAI